MIVSQAKSKTEPLYLESGGSADRSVIPRGVAIGLGGSGNRPGQCQAPWKYLGASSPHRKFNQVLRPESQEPSGSAKA
jgi:hypothetical protein